MQGYFGEGKSVDGWIERKAFEEGYEANEQVGETKAKRAGMKQRGVTRDKGEMTGGDRGADIMAGKMGSEEGAGLGMHTAELRRCV